jgi:putative drug exporter of the RND superfamily
MDLPISRHGDDDLAARVPLLHVAQGPDDRCEFPSSMSRVTASISSRFCRDGSGRSRCETNALATTARRRTAADRNLLLPLILVVVFLILALLLRAVVAPLILTATVVLWFAAALGVSAFFFNHVFNFGGADTSFPLFMFVFLVALGIDYNIFLMTRVREEAHRRDARHGAITGLAATGGVITSAGFVLAGTFAVLATIPSTFLTELGFAVAFGILLDTFIVRSVLSQNSAWTSAGGCGGSTSWHTTRPGHRPNSARNAPPP